MMSQQHYNKKLKNGDGRSSSSFEQTARSSTAPKCTEQSTTTTIADAIPSSTLASRPTYYLKQKEKKVKTENCISNTVKSTTVDPLEEQMREFERELAQELGQTAESIKIQNEEKSSKEHLDSINQQLEQLESEKILVELDEQIDQWQRVVKLEKKAHEFISKNLSTHEARGREVKITNSKGVNEEKKNDYSEHDDNYDIDLDSLNDWRTKNFIEG